VSVLIPFSVRPISAEQSCGWDKLTNLARLDVPIRFWSEIPQFRDSISSSEFIHLCDSHAVLFC
jgi:hypothetical protein